MAKCLATFREDFLCFFPLSHRWLSAAKQLADAFLGGKLDGRVVCHEEVVEFVRIATMIRLAVVFNIDAGIVVFFAGIAAGW